MRIFVVFTILIAILVASFALQNTQVAQLNFLWWQVEVPVVILSLCTFLAGFLLALLIALPGSIKKKWQLFKLKFNLNRLESKFSKTQKKLDSQIKKESDRVSDKDNKI